MKVLKINKKDHVLKFTTKALMNLNAKGITLTSLSADMEKLNLISLYEAFHEGLKFANNNITLDETYELIAKMKIPTTHEEGVAIGVVKIIKAILRVKKKRFIIIAYLLFQQVFCLHIKIIYV